MSDKKGTIKVDDGGSRVKYMTMDLPSNSHKSREEKQEPVKKVNKVIKGGVVTQKKSLGKKFAETFFGDEIDNVASYIIHDVIIPATKKTISDMVSGGIEMLLFGESRGSRTTRDGGRSYVSYNSMTSRHDRDRRDDRLYTSKKTARHDFSDIILESRGDAEEVLSNLVDLIEDYGIATVADLYDAVGITSNFTDNKYGWTNLRAATVSRVRNGYLLNLPKTVLLD